MNKEFQRERDLREKLQDDYSRNNEELKSALKLINEIEEKLKIAAESEERAQQKITDLYERFMQTQTQKIEEQEKYSKLKSQFKKLNED